MATQAAPIRRRKCKVLFVSGFAPSGHPKHRNDLLETSEDINDFLDFLVAFSSEQQSIEQETQVNQTQAVAKAISQLSQRQQEAINLRFYHSMSLDQMTQLMGLSKQSVSNLLFKAYSVLRLTIKGIQPLILLFLQLSRLIN